MRVARRVALAAPRFSRVVAPPPPALASWRERRLGTAHHRAALPIPPAGATPPPPPPSASARRASKWTGAGGPDPLGDGARLGRHDARPPPPPVCASCARRHCRCEDKPPARPPTPGPEDCCQSAPQCTFCVWIVHEERLAEFRAWERGAAASSEKTAAAPETPHQKSTPQKSPPRTP